MMYWSVAKEISFIALVAMLFSQAEPSDQQHEDHFCEINYYDFGPVVQEISFEDILYLELWRPFCSAEQND